MGRELRFLASVALWIGTTAPLTAQLPPGWSNQDIGGPAAAGNVDYDATTRTWTIQADGSGIRGNSDQFRFVYKPMSGSGELVARIVSLEPAVHEWTMAGVMIRLFLDAGSPYAFMGMTPNGPEQGNGVTYWGRALPGTNADHESSGEMTFPYWVKIVRDGQVFAGYHSLDGKDWAEQWSSEEPLVPQDTYIGFAVTSSVEGTPVRAVFDAGSVKAHLPDPADGTIGMNVPLLQWSPGQTAHRHSVYLGSTPELTDEHLVSPLQPSTLYFHAAGFEPGARYYWRVDEVETDQVTVHTGDVWTFLTQDTRAYYPVPPDGAYDVSPMPDLTWMPIFAAAGHQVYFSRDRDAVGQGAVAADQGTLDAADVNFAPGQLDPLTTYHWRVDETRPDGTTAAGKIWSFTTYLPLEDFESYTDNLEAGQAVFQTWIDGLENGTGSVAGYESSADATFSETAVVYSGDQSLPLRYNNADPPYYSEVQRDFDAPQNWTAGGADTLILHARGQIMNEPGRLYIAIEDGSGRRAAAAHPDGGILRGRDWTQWELSLSRFAEANVNLAAVQSIAIGVGDPDNPTPGPTGLLFVDDLALAIASN